MATGEGHLAFYPISWIHLCASRKVRLERVRVIHSDTMGQFTRYRLRAQLNLYR